jgi:hypothetical protein
VRHTDQMRILDGSPLGCKAGNGLMRSCGTGCERADGVRGTFPGSGRAQGRHAELVSSPVGNRVRTAEADARIAEFRNELR